jgi:hypothetical protein
VIQQTIHSNERLPGRRTGRRKNTANRKASMQTERYRHSVPDNIPVRKAPAVPGHADSSGGGRLIFSRKARRAEAGRKAGRPAPPTS